ncbi:hypothetical protein [Gaiella sp.]|uniref:hypothetical protein n=1 Tax=Gaiella sp. TaxID=2663207 RepID=UPI002E3572E2|nr:hypothetical protein [Gaiella sp.]HEX5585219.1 hypothetical protein [Gaiella sp.]
MNETVAIDTPRQTGDERYRAAAWVACAALVVLTMVAVALLALARSGRAYAASDWLGEGTDAFMVLVYAAVGVVVTLRRPANLVGWALVLAGLGSIAGGAADAYAELALLGRPELGLPGGAAAAAVSPGSWTPLMAGVFLLLATFPSGAVPPGRRRIWVSSVLVGFASVWATITVATRDLDSPFEQFENPFSPSWGDVAFAAAVPLLVACLLSVVAAGVDVVRRFRRSEGQEREQFKWLASSATLLVVTFPFAAAFNWSRVAGGLFSLALIALPISVGIAVLRYHLYAIDRIVSRTLTYAALTVVLGAAYAGLVLGGQALFSSFAGGSNLAIAVSTLIAAALFLPLRSRIQRVVDRRFNRRQYDAQRTLEAFGSRLRNELELDALRGDLVDVVSETMQPAHARLWLRRAP